MLLSKDRPPPLLLLVVVLVMRGTCATACL